MKMIRIGTTRKLGEPDAHVIMRHWKTVSGTLLIVAIVLLVVCLCCFRSAAYLAALSAMFLFVIFVAASMLERYYGESQLRLPGQTDINRDEINADVTSARISTILLIVSILALGSLSVALTVSHWSQVGIVAAAAFLLTILFTLPQIPSLVNEAGADELEKVTHHRIDTEQVDESS